MRTERRRASETRKKSRSASGSRRVSSGVASRLAIMLAVVAAVVFGVAIFFKIHTVEVQGNTIYSSQEVIAASGIQSGDNLFTLNKEAAAGSIKAGLPYVETVSINRFLPDKVVIEVKESDAVFAVTSDTNTTWLINSVGKALEQVSDSTAQPAQTPSDDTQQAANGDTQPETGSDVQPSDAENAPQEPDNATSGQESGTEPSGETAQPETPANAEETSSDAQISTGALTLTRDGKTKTVPRITGITVNSPRVGTVVTSAGTANLSAALAVIAELEGTGLLDHIAQIDVEKEYDIVLWYDDRYEIKLGGTEDLTYKINYLTVIIDSLSDFQAGTIDLTFTDSNEARVYSRE